MSSCLVLVDEDPKIQSALAYAFEREGAGVRKAGTAAEALAFVDVSQVDLMIVGLDGRRAADLARVLRARGDAAARLPLVIVGDSEDRDAALAAGATDFLARPVYLRDIVSLGGLHFAAGSSDVRSWEGDLEDFVGLYYLVRALSAARRTGVLTLGRPTRHGELRFVKGEVTSAAVGTLDGLAAFHQLLLWTDARFEFRHEDVTPRRQIPLEPADLLEDAQQFLKDFREVSAGLSPSNIYLQDPELVAREGRNLGVEVSRVLKLFDGVRSLADVVEDSAFRVAETLKVTMRLLESQLIRSGGERDGRGSGALRESVEDWLIGQSRTREKGATASGEIGGASAPRHEPRTSAAESAIPVSLDNGWETLGASLAPLAGGPAGQVPALERKLAKFSSLVPAQTVTGEIVPKGAVAATPEGPTVDVPPPPVDDSRPQGIVSGEISKHVSTSAGDGDSLPSESMIISASLPREVGKAARAAAEAAAAPTHQHDSSESRPHGRAFTDLEEQFFAQEAEFARARPEPVERFDEDLAERRVRVPLEPEPQAAPPKLLSRLFGPKKDK